MDKSLKNRIDTAVKWILSCEDNRRYQLKQEQLDLVLAIFEAVRQKHNIDITCYPNNIVKFNKLDII